MDRLLPLASLRSPFYVQLRRGSVPALSSVAHSPARFPGVTNEPASSYCLRQWLLRPVSLRLRPRPANSSLQAPPLYCDERTGSTALASTGDPIRLLQPAKRQ